MALPANVDLVTVTGTFHFIDATDPDASTVEFRPSGDPWLKDAGAKAILLPKTVVCTINPQGQLVGPSTAVGADGVGVKLPAADDPDLAPNGWVYDLTIKITGLPELKYSVSLTTDKPTVDLSELAPVSPVEGGALLVTSVNGKLPNVTGAVVLTATDVGALPVSYTPPAAPVQSVSGKTGDVTLTASDVGALPVDYPVVQSVNGKTGSAISIGPAEIGALPTNATAADIGALDQAAGDVRYPRKGDLVFNVKDYGATGDGATNDTTSIQAALDAANTAGGGVVFLPADTYMVSGLTIYAKVHLVGAGRNSTILKLVNGANADVIRTKDFATLTKSGSTNGCHNWSVESLTIDGNQANNTSGAGLSCYGADWDLADISIKRCAGDGLYSEYCSQASTTPPDGSLEARITNVRFINNNGWGWRNRGPHDSQVANMVNANNVLGNLWCQSWGGATIQAGSVGVALTSGLAISVDQTLGWPSSGTAVVPVSGGGTVTIPFSSVTPTTIVVGSNPPAGTIAAGSVNPPPGGAGAKGYSSGGTQIVNSHFWGAKCPISVVVDTLTYFVGCEAEGAPTGQVHWRTSEGSWMAGSIFMGPGGEPGWGLKIGDSNYTASAITPVRNQFVTSFRNFLNDGTAANSSIVIERNGGLNTMIATSTSGAPTFGSWSTSDRVQIVGTAVSTSRNQWWGDTYLQGHLNSQGSKPTVAVGTGFATTTVDFGTDTSFEITSTNGAAANVALGSVAYVTYNAGFPSGGVRPVLTPYNAAAAAAGLYISARNLTSFTVSAQNVVPANAVLNFGVHALG